MEDKYSRGAVREKTWRRFGIDSPAPTQSLQSNESREMCISRGHRYDERRSRAARLTKTGLIAAVLTN